MFQAPSLDKVSPHLAQPLPLPQPQCLSSRCPECPRAPSLPARPLLQGPEGGCDQAGLMAQACPATSSSALGLTRSGCFLDALPRMWGTGSLLVLSCGTGKNLTLQPAFQTRVPREPFHNSLISRAWFLKSLARGTKTQVYSEKYMVYTQFPI